jgi:hypothetical protein
MTNGEFNSTRKSLRLCGQVPHGDHVLTYRKTDGSAVVISGLMRCESASACVVCSARIAKGRGEWLSKVFEQAVERGETISMLTLTVRHKKGDDLRTLLQAMEASYRNLQGTHAFKQLRSKYNAKFVRVTEVTYGKNGFHPHFHIAIIHSQGVNFNLYRSELTDIWCKWIVNNGLLAPLAKNALNIVENATNEQRAWYLTKSNGLSSLEVTNGRYKVAKGENMSIWGVHSLAVAGDYKSGKVWRAYEGGIYKKRIFVVSRGMSEEYGVYMKSEGEMSADEFTLSIPEAEGQFGSEIADNLQNVCMTVAFTGAINRETFRRIKKLNLQDEFREAIRTDCLKEFLFNFGLQQSYDLQDLLYRHELKAELRQNMSEAIKKGESQKFDIANQALELGELYVKVQKTLQGSF